jgi:hypothetical protein
VACCGGPHRAPAHRAQSRATAEEIVELRGCASVGTVLEYGTSPARTAECSCIDVQIAEQGGASLIGVNGARGWSHLVRLAVVSPDGSPLRAICCATDLITFACTRPLSAAGRYCDRPATRARLLLRCMRQDLAPFPLAASYLVCPSPKADLRRPVSHDPLLLSPTWASMVA